MKRFPKKKQILTKKKVKEKKTFSYVLEGNVLLKIIGGIATCLIIIVVLLFGAHPRPKHFVIGQIAPANIAAKVDFKYRDTDINNIIEEEQLSLIPHPYRQDQELFTSTIQSLNSFFTFLQKNREMKAHFEDMQFPVPFNKLPDTVKKQLFESDHISEIHQTVVAVVRRLMQQGIVSGKQVNDSFNDIIQLWDEKNSKWIKTSFERFYKIDDIDTAVELFLHDYRYLRLKSQELETAAVLTKFAISTNILFDEKEYNTLKEKTLSAITPVFTFVKKGELIVKRGSIVQQRNIDMLKAQYYEIISLQGWRYRGGIGLLIFILFIITVLYIHYFHRDIYMSNSRLLLLQIISIVTVLLSFLYKNTLLFFPTAEFITPIGITAILIALLLDFKLSVFFVMILSLIISIMAENKLFYAITSIAGGIVAVYSLFEARKRSSLIKAGFFSGLASGFCIFAIGTLNQHEPVLSLQQSSWGLASGFLSAFIVMGILPYLEYIFKISTDIALLELSDFNHPLLKELVVEAPGTYHHSLIVGNLTEAAAEKIQANPLMARVQSYFHDIGKLNKPEYFNENEWRHSRHDELNPSMSSLIIVSHVKDGVDLARKYKLPRQVINAIKEHHGTSLVYYFFKKAIDDSKEDEKVMKEHFRYPGPKPQTKETALVMLADSVEAASRSLTNPTPSRIKKLVDDIINSRILDGQLDESALTMKNLNDIRETFSFILTSIFHTRKQYPTDDSGQKK